MEANKTLSSALEKLDARNKVLEDKYEKVRNFKKIMKSCMAMQCVQCSKWIQTSSFTTHLSKCGYGENMEEKTINDL